MKLKLFIIIIAALATSACSVNMQTSGGYVDDIYYWPGDEIPVIVEEELSALTKSNSKNSDLVVISEISKEEDGTNKVNNYVYSGKTPDWFNEVQVYNLEKMDSTETDTLYFDEGLEGKYEVNNYLMDEDFSYSDRIRRFHDPYYYHYDPYYNFSMAWGWGGHRYMGYRGGFGYYDPWYTPMYYDPFFYGYHSPYYGYSSFYGYGGYYGYYGSYYGHHGHWNSPYYSNHYPYNHYGNYYNNTKKYHDGDRRSRRPNTVYGGGGAASARSQDGNYVPKSANTGVRASSRRNVVDGNDEVLAQKSTSVRSEPSKPVLTERRRSDSGNVRNEKSAASRTYTDGNTPANRSVSPTAVNRSRSGSNAGSTYSGTSSRSSSYTPSYSKPRTNTRATYNSRSSADYSAPKTGSSTKSSYKIPSTSTAKPSVSTRSRSYSSGSRTSSSKSYSTGTSTRSSSSSYSKPSSSSRSSSSSPSRSSYSSGSSSRSYSSPSPSRSSYSSGSSSSRSSSSSSGSSSRRR